MEKITTLAELELRIAYLEGEKKAQEIALKQELQAVQERIKPANLIKSAVKDIFSPGQAGGGLLDGAIGLASGTLTKKLVTGALGHPLRLVLGSVLQGLVSDKVAEHAGPLRKKIVNTLREFLNKKEKPTE